MTSTETINQDKASISLEPKQNNSIRATNPLRLLPLHKLLTVCLEKQEEAHWAEFIHRVQPFIARIIARALHLHGKTAKAEIVDDLVQETFLKLCGRNFKALRRFQCEQEPKLYAFLKKVAVNVACDYLRGISCSKHGGGREMVPLEFVLNDLIGPNSSGTHQRQVLVKAIFRYLAARLAEPKSAREYEVFELYYQQGFTAQEISELSHLRLTIKGVESMLRRLTREIRLEFTGA